MYLSRRSNICLTTFNLSACDIRKNVKTKLLASLVGAFAGKKVGESNRFRVLVEGGGV
jgi:hypothetical protein